MFLNIRFCFCLCNSRSQDVLNIDLEKYRIFPILCKTSQLQAQSVIPAESFTGLPVNVHVMEI